MRQPDEYGLEGIVGLFVRSADAQPEPTGTCGRCREGCLDKSFLQGPDGDETIRVGAVQELDSQLATVAFRAVDAQTKVDSDILCCDWKVVPTPERAVA